MFRKSSFLDLGSRMNDSQTSVGGQNSRWNPLSPILAGRIPIRETQERQMPDRTEGMARSQELAREQSLTELEQAIGDREQVAGDRDQMRIDHEQDDQDEQRRSTGGGEGRDAVLDDRQARIDREQATRDVHQETLDHAQVGRDTQQDALDQTRELLSLPQSEQPATANDSAIRQGAIERATAASVRAQTALVRAQAAVVRAEASVVRAQGMGSGEAAGNAETA
jgi:hypothetical protein